MTDTNFLMANTTEETGETFTIDQAKIDQLFREKKIAEEKRKKEIGCWDCGKKLTIWDYPLGVADVATEIDDPEGRARHLVDMAWSIIRSLKKEKIEIPKGFHRTLFEIMARHYYPLNLSDIATSRETKLAKKKVAGTGYLCHTCHAESQADRKKIEEKGICFICGREDGTARQCGVHLCMRCVSPFTDIKSYGDGNVVNQEMISWWRRSIRLQNCVHDAEGYRVTGDLEILSRIAAEIEQANQEETLSDSKADMLAQILTDLRNEAKEDPAEIPFMAAALRAVFSDLLMDHLYHTHPYANADIQLEPGTYELIGERPEGLDTFTWTVSEAPVILRKLQPETPTDPPTEESTEAAGDPAGSTPDEATGDDGEG